MVATNARSLLSIAVASLALVTVASSPALARIKGPVLDSLSFQCLQLQNKSDALIAEYKNATNARREEILTELRNNGRVWREIGCQAVYGNIAMIRLPESHTVVLNPPTSHPDCDRALRNALLGLRPSACSGTVG
jgi:hypothetical protein